MTGDGGSPGEGEFGECRVGGGVGVLLRSRRIFGGRGWVGGVGVVVVGVGCCSAVVDIVVDIAVEVAVAAAVLRRLHRGRYDVFFSERRLRRCLLGSFCGSAGEAGSRLRLSQGRRRSCL